jgi:hypothetical protein
MRILQRKLKKEIALEEPPTHSVLGNRLERWRRKLVSYLA